MMFTLRDMKTHPSAQPLGFFDVELRAPITWRFPVIIRHRVPLIVLVCATLLSSHPALAQFSHQGPKLRGATPWAASGQGYSVSLSADGNTAIVGGPGGSYYYHGTACVWTRSGGIWTQQGNALVGSGAVWAHQGSSVSLSADGNTAIVGGPNGNAAWVWTRGAGVWTQQGTNLVGSGGGGYQGQSVSISADGNTAIVGGPSHNNGAGAVWVWTRSGGVWTQQGDKLVGSGAGGNAAQGQSVSISADGNTVIVGGSSDNYSDFSSVGAAWVWTRSGGVWIQQGDKLVGSDAMGKAAQGKSVSISADGNTAIVGGYRDNSNAGAAWVWTRSGSVWTQQGTKLVGLGAVGTNVYQGYSVSLSADGNMAIIGGSGDNNSTGAAWVWTRSGGVWTQQGNKLVGSGAVGSAYQGSSVSLSADGSTAIVGGPSEGFDTGAAWVFTNATLAVFPPAITTQPVSVFRQTGENATFSVTASGQPPPHYQWHNGTGILANETNSSLTIANAQADASYYVVVSNSYGTVTSQSAQLKILVNYTTAIATPASPTPPPPPPKPPSQHNLVVVTHGWDPAEFSNFSTDAPQWVYDMTDSIRNNLSGSSWTVIALSWNGSGGATTSFPGGAASHAETIGKKYGLSLSAQGWSHVHFIGHSAGAVLIQAAAEELIAHSASPVEIHTTFLDPYDWSFFGGPSRFGAGSAWSDNYFEADPSGPLTGGRMDHSYNVDISGLDPHPFYHPADQHSWAYEFYQKTITGDLGSTSEGFGFPLSKEGGDWIHATIYFDPGNSPYLLGGGAALCSGSVPVQHNHNLLLDGLSALWNGTVYVTDNGFDLVTTLIEPLKPKTPIPSANTFGSPVWLSLGITVTNRVNFVSFDARFTSATNAAGLLTVYWDTNEIGVADETVTTPGLQNYSFALPATYSSGNYVLGFRLDSFTNIVSSISITNVSLGFAGLTNAVALGISHASGNNQLTLTGPTNYNYLVQSSSNLVDWIPAVIVPNTNGTVLFPIPAATNSNAQFYRAVSP